MATNVIPASPCQPREAATPAGSLRVPAHGQVHALLAGKSTSLARRDQRFESPLLQRRVRLAGIRLPNVKKPGYSPLFARL